MLEEFGRKVKKAIKEYEREKYSKPKYIVMNRNTLIFVKDDVRVRQVLGLSDKKIYGGLYIAIDNELEDYDFAILG